MSTSEAKQYAQRNRQGSDWFTHDKPESATAATVTEAAPAPAAEVPPPAVDASDAADGSVTQRTQMIKPKCDSNQWYKYDGDSEVSKAAPVTEGGAYCRRDKAGSASEWFSHDHPDGASNSDGQQSELLKEGNANAARMRSESDAWFTHDKAVEQTTQGHTSSRAHINRPVSSEMHGVFHHESAK